jgi:hypothetical protein
VVACCLRGRPSVAGDLSPAASCFAQATEDRLAKGDLSPTASCFAQATEDRSAKGDLSPAASSFAKATEDRLAKGDAGVHIPGNTVIKIRLVGFAH